MRNLLLKKRQKYLDLVLRIGNDPSNSWVNPFVVSFILEELKKDNAAYEEFSKIVETGSKGIFATFENKPSKIEKLAVALTDRHHPLKRHIIALGRDISCPAATTRGRVIFRAALSELLGIFRLDQWFASKLSSDDFLLLDSVRCMILKKPSSIPPLEGTWLLSKVSSKKYDHDMYTWKASNLSDLWGFMEEHYKDDKGELCMYFDPLKFEMTRASSKVQKGWFLDYVENMQALKSSMARKQFVCESAKVYKMAGVVDNEHLKAALDNKPCIVQDWRNTIMNSNDFLLQHCFWHGIKLEKLVHLMSGIQAAVEKGQYGRIPEECYHAARENTVGAIIEYKRNLIQHLIETFLKEKREEHANEKKKQGQGQG